MLPALSHAVALWTMGYRVGSWDVRLAEPRVTGWCDTRCHGEAAVDPVPAELQVLSL